MDGKNTSQVSEGVKHLFVSLCRLHKSNNYDKFDSSNVHSKVDDMIHLDQKSIKKDEIKQVVSQHETIIKHDSTMNDLSEKLNLIISENQQLTSQLNEVLSKNKELEEKVNRLEDIPVVKLVPKSKDKKPLIISKDEYERLQAMREKIIALEAIYERLLTEETHDEALLTNYKERIELLKGKLREQVVKN